MERLDEEFIERSGTWYNIDNNYDEHDFDDETLKHIQAENETFNKEPHQLDNQDIRSINCEITLNETLSVIKYLKCNKAYGIDKHTKWST